MEIRSLSLLAGAREATGLTIVIDVFRAFTTAAYAVAGGARAICPVGTLEEARAARHEDPTCLLVGEREGKPPEDFDHGNSPSALRDLDVDGRTIVLTTSAGTRGLAAATGADELLTGALVNVGATVAYVRARQPDVVSIVAMGTSGEAPAEEDAACAELIIARLTDEPVDLDALDHRIRSAPSSERFGDPERPWFPRTDLDCCLDVDRFDFALRSEPHPLVGRALRPIAAPQPHGRRPPSL